MTLRSGTIWTAMAGGWFKGELPTPGTITDDVGMTVARLTSTSCRISFTKPTDGDFVQALIYRADNKDFTSATLIKTFTDTGTYDDTGLTSNGTYYYQVVAMDNDDTAARTGPERFISLSADDVTGNLSPYETSRSRDAMYKGRRYYGERLFCVPKGDLPNYKDDYKKSASNVWPGYAAEWSASTDYVADNLVMGDGVNDTYVYKCILAHEVGDEGAQRPPNTTYWSRVKFAPTIYSYFINPRDMQDVPGFSWLRTLYAHPKVRDLLHENLDKAIIEVKMMAEAVKVFEESVAPPEWDSSKVYAIGERVSYHGSVLDWAVSTVYALGTQVWGDADPDAEAYECIFAHTSSVNDQPPHIGYWLPAERGSAAAAALQTYICIKSGSNQNPVTEETYWRASSRVIEGPAIGRKWDTTVVYEPGDLVWARDAAGKTTTYRCILTASAAIVTPPVADSIYWEVAHSKWVCVDGQNTELKTEATIRLKSATNSFDPDTHIQMMGHTNSDAISAFGTFARAGTLLFVGYVVWAEAHGDGISEQEHYFLWRPEGWASGCRVQRLRRMVQDIGIVNKDGIAASGETSRVTVWMPDPVDAAVPIEGRNLTKGAISFAPFTAMATW